MAIDRVIEEIEYQIDHLKTRSYAAQTLKRASEGLTQAQKWYDECLAECAKEEALIAEYRVALEILRLGGT